MNRTQIRAAAVLAVLSAACMTGCDKMSQWLNPPPEQQAPADPVSIDRGAERVASTSALLKKYDFRTSDKVNAIPPALLTQLTAVSGDAFRLADAKAKWADGDVSSSTALLPRRLIFVANYSNIWIFAYEHSRNVRHTHIAFVELSGSKVSYYWSALARYPVESLSDLSKILGNPEYYILKSATDTKPAGDDL